MKLDIAEMIVEQLQNMGIEAELRNDYSGRYMFSKTTAGIVTSLTNAPMIGFALALALANNADDPDNAVEDLNNFDAANELPQKYDNMGRDMIFY
jgi:ABC-type transport system substrate-binding protein